MPDFVVAFRGPGFPEGRQRRVTAPSIEVIQQQLAADGLEPLGFSLEQPSGAPPASASATSTTTPPPSTTTTTLPSLARRTLGAITPSGGDVAQLLGSGAALAVPGARRFAIPAGVAARTAYGAAREGGMGAAVEGAKGVVTEALTPPVRGALRGAQTIIGPKAIPFLTRGVSAAAKAAGIPLAAHEMLPALKGMAERAGEALVGPFARRQAESVTRAIPAFAREQVGSLLERPQAGATGLRTNFRGLLRRVPKPLRDATVKHVLDDTGLDITRMSSRKLYQTIRSEPQLAARAVSLLGQAAGESVDVQRQRITRTFWSQLLDRSTRTAPSNLRFPGAYHGGFLDAKMVLKELSGLNKKIGVSGMQQLFGKDGMKELTEFTQLLGKASLGPKFLAREGLATGEHVIMQEQRERGIRLAPFLIAAGAAMTGIQIPGGHALMHGAEFGAGAGLAQASARLIQQSTTDSPRFLAFLLTHPLGIRWLATGVKAMQAGTPDAVIVPALTQSFAQLVQRGALPVAEGVAGSMMPPAAAQGLPALFQ